jgi:hypothetical protein
VWRVDDGLLEVGWREKAEEAVVGRIIYGSKRIGEGARPDQLSRLGWVMGGGESGPSALSHSQINCVN